MSKKFTFYFMNDNDNKMKKGEHFTSTIARFLPLACLVASMCVSETLMLSTDCYIKWLFQWSLSNLHHVHIPLYLVLNSLIYSCDFRLFKALFSQHIISIHTYVPNKWEKTFEYIMHTDYDQRIEKGSRKKKINMRIKYSSECVK